MTPQQATVYAELYRRGALSGARQQAYEALVQRGAVHDTYAQGRLAVKNGGVLGGVGGFLQHTFNSIPGASELEAAPAALGGAADDLMAGRAPDLSHGWNAARAEQAGEADEFQAGHPILANTGRAAGVAAQVAPFVLSGGTSAAPELAATARAGFRAAAKQFAVRTGKNAITGAAIGAVNGAAQPGTLQQRLASAAHAVPAGAAFGAAVPTALGTAGAAVRGLKATAGIVPRLGAMTSEAGDAASRAFTGKSVVDQANAFSPAQQEAARQRALAYVQQLGGTPEALQAAAAKAGGKPLTTAEALGPQGISQASGLIRRAGTAAQTADATMAARGADRGDRILADVHQITGVDPAAAKGDLDSIVQSGRANAGPLFDAVRAQPGPVSSPGLDAILQRPVVAKAASNAATDLQNAGIDPTVHGFRPVAAPDGGQTFAPLAGPHAQDIAAARADLQALNAKQTGGLFRQIQTLGGVKVRGPDGSTLPGPDIGDAVSQLRAPGVINNKSGMSPENMAQALADRGWFGGNPGDPSKAFETAFNDHANGSPVYHPDAATPLSPQHLMAIEQEASDAGVQGGDHPTIAARKLATFRAGDAQEAQAIQEEDPARANAFAEFDRLSAPRQQYSSLTPQALDLVRQNLGDMVDRDAFGKILPDSQSRGNYNINQAKGALTGVLAGDGTAENPGLIPGYRQALDASGDYLSAKGAYDRTQGRLFGTAGAANDPRNFADYFQGLNPAEQKAAQASVVNDIYTRLQNGQLRPGSFDSPAVQQKLATAFGPDQASTLIDRMNAEASMSRASARMTPNLNSTTGDVVGAANDRSDLGFAIGGARVIGNAMVGNAPGALRSAGGMLLPFASAARQPINMATRNALADILYQPPAATAADLQRVMQANAFSGPNGGYLPASITSLRLGAAAGQGQSQDGGDQLQ